MHLVRRVCNGSDARVNKASASPLTMHKILLARLDFVMARLIAVLHCLCLLSLAMFQQCRPVNLEVLRDAVRLLFVVCLGFFWIHDLSAWNGLIGSGLLCALIHIDLVEVLKVEIEACLYLLLRHLFGLNEGIVVRSLQIFQLFLLRRQ